MPQTPPIVLTVAGFDPSSGAGVTADMKTIAAHGCYGVGCITALTVQSTVAVRRVETVAPGVVTETLEELAGDFDIAAVRIGMLGSAAVAAAVARFLGNRKIPNVVLDPVLRSSSGAELLDREGLKVLVKELIPLTAVITPNIEEAAELTGFEVTNSEQMKQAANRLHAMGAAGVVITGGHLEKAIDLLSFVSKRSVQQELFKSDRLRSTSTHGTGCAFATAMACHLAMARGLPEAVMLAKTFVAAAISNAPVIGKGKGPVHHLYRMQQQRRTIIADPEPVG